MAQRNSGYKRLPLEFYQTPPGVTEIILPHIPKRVSRIWEPAAGDGQMADVLLDAGYAVRASDIQTGTDFFKIKTMPVGTTAIVTNSPYGNQGRVAQHFIEHALALTKPCRGFVAMLLKVDFNSGKTRRHLFAEHRAFVGKIVLVRRVRWIPNTDGGPSDNHAWYCWDWTNKAAPTIAYETPAEEGPHVNVQAS